MKVTFRNMLAALLLAQATVAMGQEVRQEALAFSPSFNPVSVVKELRPAIICHGQSYDSPVELGFYAHEVRSVWPMLVYQRQTKVQTGKNTYTEKTVDIVDLDQIIPLLVLAVQRQAREIDSLQVQLSALQNSQ